MVFLCTEDQLKEVKNFCVTHKERSILGVDIIFNLRDCFETFNSGLGALFMHCMDDTCANYQRLFSHSRTKCDANIDTEVGFCELVVRSDEEEAIMKAVRQNFPSATQLLCQRQLEENVRRYLQHKVGVPDNLKNEIASLIIGKDGLIDAKESCRS